MRRDPNHAANGQYDENMTTRFLKTAAWLMFAFIVFSTVSPIHLRPHDFLPVDVDRALAFALMAFLFVLAYPQHMLLCAVLVIASAGAIELLQLLSPTRHAELHDVVVKALGALAGVLAAGAVNSLRMRRTKT